MIAEDGPGPLGTILTERLQGFLGRLREEGLRPGLGSGIDLARALRSLSVLDREEFREACRATLAKSPRDLDVVDRVFDEYFRPTGAPVPPSSEEGKVPAGRPRVGRSRRGADSESSEADETDEKVRGRYSPVAPSAFPSRSRVSPERLRRFRSGAQRFRREVATLPGRRWAFRGSDAVDLRRTARRSLRSVGEWVELSRRQRDLRRADLLILWDVSGSMREHTSDLLGFVYALHRVVRRTRVFAFGHEIVEVTPLLEGRSYDRAVPRLAEYLEGTGGGTQIAHCLSEFRRLHGSEVRRTTTVLVLSDGWDLGEPAELADELRRLRGRAYAIVWVNPYAAKRGFRPATAALRSAMPYLDLLASPEDFPTPHGGAGGVGLSEVAATG